MANPACDNAVRAAARVNPEIQRLVEEADDLHKQMNRATREAAEMAELEGYVPSPSQMQGSGIGEAILGGIKKGGEWSYNRGVDVLNARVAGMLSNPLTHIKNMTATGGQVSALRPFEDAIAIAVSRLPGGSKRTFNELNTMASGQMRAANDFANVFKAVGEEAAKTGHASAEAFGRILEEQGYPKELALHSKQQMLRELAFSEDPAGFGIQAINTGSEYLYNAAFGTQFSALQLEDTLFKMMSYRGNVQQQLMREGIDKGVQAGEALDSYVMNNWGARVDEIKTKGSIEDFIEDSAVYQAAEDTFTQRPETKLGSMLSAKSIPVPGFRSPMKLPFLSAIAPFRSIYVNMYRQGLSKRLLAPLNMADPRGGNIIGEDLMGRNGKLAQEAAVGRFLGSHAILAATMSVFGAAGVKVWGPDEMNPQQRDLQRQVYGKVGRTIQIGDTYIPVDMIPPPIAIGMGYAVGFQDAAEEMDYRIARNPEEGKKELYMKAAGPLMQMAAEGPWVTEYMSFLSRISFAVQHGNPGTLKDMAVSFAETSVKLPDWYLRIRGKYEPNSTMTRDSFGEIYGDMMGKSEGKPLRHSLYGDPIPKAKRIGYAIDTPWPHVSKRVGAMLEKAGYIKDFPDNNQWTITDNANVPKQYKVMDMTPDMIARYQYLTGKALVGGKTMETSLEGLAAQTNLVSALKEHSLRKRVDDIVSMRRQHAKMLVTFSPEFRAYEKMTATVVEYMTKEGTPQAEMRKFVEQRQKIVNTMRERYKGQF